jgi:Tol biopolymer transport system component
MAPEQIEGGEVDARSDIFSFGVVLYEMLTGQLPFRGEHEAAMVYSIVNEDPEPIEKYRTDLSPILVNLIQRALEKNPRDRYQSMDDMVIELRRLQKKTSRVVRKPAEVQSQVGAPESGPTVGDRAATAEAVPKKPPSLFQNKLILLGAAIIALIIVIAAVYQFILRKDSGKQQTFSVLAMKITRLTSDGKAVLAAISPDGKYVVFCLRETGKQSLWLRQVASNSNVQIMPPSDVRYFGLTFSQDGNYIYYGMRQRPSGQSAIYQLPVLGGTPRKIVDDVQSDIALSSDDKRFAFVQSYPATGESALVVAKSDGSEEKRITSHKGSLWFFGRPAWSPDGKAIACILGSSEGRFHHSVVTVELEGAVERPLTQQDWLWIAELQWLPDGSGLIMNATDRGSFMSQIWRVSYPAGEANRITNDLLDYGSLSLTNDAQTLCVVQGDYRSNIWILPEGGATHAQQITNGRLEGILGLGWTPDGKIVYCSSAGVNPDLWIMDRDGKNQKQLTTDPAWDENPAVSPDGKFILFISDRSGAPSVWRIEPDGSRPRQLTFAEDYSPNISPDSKWFVFDSWAKGPDLITKLPMEGGEPVQLSESNGYSPAISPDGRLIAYVHVDEQRRTNQIEVVPAEGGKPFKKADLPSTPDQEIRWSRDGLALHYIDRSQGVGNIWSQPLSGGPPSQITDFKTDYVGHFDWSRDWKFLAVARYSVSSDVLLMSNAK